MRLLIVFGGFLLISFSGCDRELRGHCTKSADNQTYLIIENNNGGACGPIIVDGQIWPYKIGTPGKIKAGEHWIRCGGEDKGKLDSDIQFTIAESTVFYFDYWGP